MEQGRLAAASLKFSAFRLLALHTSFLSLVPTQDGLIEVDDFAEVACRELFVTGAEALFNTLDLGATGTLEAKNLEILGGSVDWIEYGFLIVSSLALRLGSRSVFKKSENCVIFFAIKVFL